MLASNGSSDGYYLFKADVRKVHPNKKGKPFVFRVKNIKIVRDLRINYRDYVPGTQNVYPCIYAWAADYVRRKRETRVSGIPESELPTSFHNLPVELVAKHILPYLYKKSRNVNHLFFHIIKGISNSTVRIHVLIACRLKFRADKLRKIDFQSMLNSIVSAMRGYGENSENFIIHTLFREHQNPKSNMWRILKPDMIYTGCSSRIYRWDQISDPSETLACWKNLLKAYPRIPILTFGWKPCNTVQGGAKIVPWEVVVKNLYRYPVQEVAHITRKRITKGLYNMLQRDSCRKTMEIWMHYWPVIFAIVFFLILGICNASNKFF